MLNIKFEKSSVDLNNLIYQQRKLGDIRGISIEDSKAECSKDQEFRSIKDKLIKQRTKRSKIRKPLEEAFKLLIVREKRTKRQCPT